VDLLIVGASARAAAFSAMRIGLRPTCIDLFADADLADAAPVHRVEPDHYPDGLATIAAGLPPMPWLYTGAIENRPDLIDRISTGHPLLGNPSNAVRAVRDPLALAETFRDCGLSSPGVRLDPTGLPLDGSWLRKPLASAGGRPLSAILVGDASTSRCLGITRQFVGKPGNRFAYRGSLAPCSVSAEVFERVERLGEAVAARFGLVGLFGIDLILKDSHPWPVEVNPRYTASVEILEWALGRSLLAEHFRACGLSREGADSWSGPESFAAKAIVFADRPFRWPSDWVMPAFNPAEFPEIADVPNPGTTFRPGDPVLTVFARGDSPGECRRVLAAQVLAWRRRIRSLAA
jgi:uncharacterized protein